MYKVCSKKGTSKNSQRHAELDSVSPCFQEIADHVRNDKNTINWVLRSPPKTILYAVCIISGLIVGCVFYFSYNPTDSILFPKCPFLLLTGLKCPGCGSQREIHALLHLDFYTTFRHNAMLIFSLPYIILLLGAKITSFISPNSTFPAKIQTAQIIWSFFVLVVLFWISRNIWSF